MVDRDFYWFEIFLLLLVLLLFGEIFLEIEGEELKFSGVIFLVLDFCGMLFVFD